MTVTRCPRCDAPAVTTGGVVRLAYLTWCPCARRTNAERRPYPVDSADAREPREADAERQDAELKEKQQHDAECGAGWLFEAADGRPIARPRCRPHVAQLAACGMCGHSRGACDRMRSEHSDGCCDGCRHSVRRAR